MPIMIVAGSVLGLVAAIMLYVAGLSFIGALLVWGASGPVSAALALALVPARPRTAEDDRPIAEAA